MVRLDAQLIASPPNLGNRGQAALGREYAAVFCGPSKGSGFPAGANSGENGARVYDLPTPHCWGAADFRVRRVAVPRQLEL